MGKSFNPLLPTIIAAVAVAGLSAPSPASGDEGLSDLERAFLAPPALVTAGMPRAGEGYFSPDGRTICYQAVPEGYPF